MYSHSRLRALCVAGGLVFLFAGGLSPSALHAQDNALPTESCDMENARRVIELLPPAPSIALQVPSSADIPVPTPLPTPTATPTAKPAESLRAAITRLKLPLPLPQARIVVTKAQRTLELFNGEVLVKTYRAALGSNPAGHKQAQGDGRTPEGQFYLCSRNAKDSAFHIFLGLSYPALPDATRAVNSKVISWREYQIIRQRLAARGAPLWRTRLGGWVGIHGGTGGKFAQRKMQERSSPDWTAGCVALTDKEIAELFAATKFGTPVLIRP